MVRMSIEPSQMISHESIRTRLKRRVRWTMAVGLCGFVLFIAGTTMRPKDFTWLPIAGFLTFFAAMISVQWFTKCPKCNSRLGHDMSQRLGLTFFGKAPNFCPFCGVSLDEQWP